MPCSLNPGLRHRRNYDYDRFWVAFPLKDASGEPLMSLDGDIELVVRIFDKEGRVRWHVPDSIRQRLASRAPAK